MEALRLFQKLSSHFLRSRATLESLQVVLEALRLFQNLSNYSHLSHTLSTQVALESFNGSRSFQVALQIVQIFIGRYRQPSSRSRISQDALQIAIDARRSFRKVFKSLLKFSDCSRACSQFILETVLFLAQTLSSQVVLESFNDSKSSQVALQIAIEGRKSFLKVLKVFWKLSSCFILSLTRTYNSQTILETVNIL